MSVRKKHKIFRKAIFVATLPGIAILWSCRSESYNEPGDIAESALEFRGMVTGVHQGAHTRDLTQDPVNVEPNVFKGKFYIEIYDPEKADSPQSAFGVYRVPSNGNGGMLTFDGLLEDKPNWFDPDDNHYFWSWTAPWLDPEYIQHPPTPDDNDDNDDTGEGNEENQGTRDGENDPEGGDQSGYEPSRSPLTVSLRDTFVNEFNFTDSVWNEGSWGNGYVLETLVGAKSGPYNYRQNGPEVPLQFQHLVSKISLRSLVFYGSDGSINEDYKANIMFINMPTEFTLYPHPDGNNGTTAESKPVAVTNFASANPNGGITFAFTNPKQDANLTLDEQVEYRDKFYICPEIDFSNVQFKVSLYEVEDKYINRGEYWGNFDNVVFERDPGTDYDNPKDPNNPDSYRDDSKVLHAGEIMYFDLVVKQSGGGGTRIYVADWATRPTQSAKHYPHPGIYTDGEAREVASGTGSWQSKFELYGDGFTDGENQPATPSLPEHIGIFPLYSDIERTENTFPIGAGYVLNGMGYIIDMPGPSTTITIGNMVDVYIRVGQYMIYIDSDGNIFSYDPDNNRYIPSNNKIDITDSTSSYRINITDGSPA